MKMTQETKFAPITVMLESPEEAVGLNHIMNVIVSGGIVSAYELALCKKVQAYLHGMCLTGAVK